MKKTYTLDDVLSHLEYFTEEDNEYPQKAEARIFITLPEEDVDYKDSEDEETH